MSRLSRLVLTTLFAAGNLAVSAPGVRAEPLPAPTEPLKDYQARGVIQLDIPPSPATRGDGTKYIDAGINLVIPLQQAYVWPDRMWNMLEVLNTRQVSLALAQSERTYNPAAGYIVEISYKNVDPDGPTPMDSAQLSMATYAKVLKSLTTGRILPAEDPDKLEAAHKTRIGQLAAMRKELEARKAPDDLEKINAYASEAARLHDDLQQLEFRRTHPCTIVEFDNKDLGRHLQTHGLMGSRGSETLANGKTTFWVTKAEGLPIKMETTDANGHVALYLCFTAIKINSGLHSSDLGLGAPAGTQMFSVEADVRQKDWRTELTRDLAAKIERAEQARSDRSRPPTAPVKDPKKGKKKS